MGSRILDYATIMHPILVETGEEELQTSKVGVLPPRALPFFYHLY